MNLIDGTPGDKLSFSNTVHEPKILFLYAIQQGAASIIGIISPFAAIILVPGLISDIGIS
jgi:hypothetical protein